MGNNRDVTARARGLALFYLGLDEGANRRERSGVDASHRKTNAGCVFEAQNQAPSIVGNRSDPVDRHNIPNNETRSRQRLFALRIVPQLGLYSRDQIEFVIVHAIDALFEFLRE